MISNRTATVGGAIHLSPVLQSENEIGSKPTSRNAVLPVSDHADRIDFNGCFLKVLRNFCHKIDQITFCNSHSHSGKILAKSFYYINYGLSIIASKVSQIISAMRT